MKIVYSVFGQKQKTP